MASILLLSRQGEGLPLALRLVREGHIVKVYFKEPNNILEGSRNPSRVGDPRKMLDQYDLVLGSTGLGDLCDELASKKMVLGGSVFSDKLTDQEYCTKVMKTLTDTLPQDGEELEITTEGWFNGKEWVRPFSHSLKKRRLMYGDIGPLTEGMGDIVWPTNGDKLTAKVLEPLAPLLIKVNHLGPVSITCVVTEGEVKFTKVSASFNYDCVQAWLELIQVLLFDYLYNIASGYKNEVPFHDEQSIAVRLRIHPWNDQQVVEIPKEAEKHVWLEGVGGVVGCVTARGQTVRECQRRVYRTIKNVVTSKDVQYRTDIGSDVDESRRQLKEWGWVNA